MVQQVSQCTSQVCGITARRPRAPALAQRAASSLIFSTRPWAEGRALSNTQSFLCFQIIHGTSRVVEASPLRKGLGVACLAAIHQVLSVASLSGGRQGIRNHDKTSN